MATTKISQLPTIKSITSNTSNTLMLTVDMTNGITGKMTANAFADGLYSFNPLKVGTKSIQLPNTIGQFTDISENYIQVNLQNQDDLGTADYVITANTGTDTTYYIDLGFTNEQYDNNNINNSLGTAIEPLSGYLYVQGDTQGGNLVIGTTSSGTEIRFISGGVNSENVISKITPSGLNFVNNKGIIFSDGTTLNSNTLISSSISSSNTWLQSNDANTLTTSKLYTDTANTSLKSYVDTANTSMKSYVDTANTSLKSYVDTANTYLRSYVDTANTYLRSYVDTANTSSRSYVDTANTSMKSYVDTANTYLRSYVDTANTSMKSYADAANTSLRSYVDTANTSLKSYVDTVFNDNIASNREFANASFNLANSISETVTSLSEYTSSIGTTANNALANTSGTFDGNLNITGNIIAQTVNTGNLYITKTSEIGGNLHVVGNISTNSTLSISNSNFLATESALTISSSSIVSTPSNDGYMLHISGKNGIPSRIVTDSYGTGSYSVYASRTARGTVTSPSAVQANDVIGRLAANGYGTTKFQQFGTARIDFVASENYTDANTGSQIQFWNCTVGSNTLTNILTLNGDSAIFSGVVYPQKGFIYNPTLVSGNTTNLTIDISNDSLLKVQSNNDLDIVLSNFIPGKIVELWITNLSGSNKTVTHGCSALNSTKNSDTFTIPATSSAYLKYFSIHSDLSNTFVSIIHS